MVVGEDLRKIGDMDEGIVEGSENAGDTEDEFTCKIFYQPFRPLCEALFQLSNSPSRTWGPSEMFSVAARSTFFLGGILMVTARVCRVLFD